MINGAKILHSIDIQNLIFIQCTFMINMHPIGSTLSLFFFFYNLNWFFILKKEEKYFPFLLYNGYENDKFGLHFLLFFFISISSHVFR